jgi:hypothetical protein
MCVHRCVRPNFSLSLFLSRSSPSIFIGDLIYHEALSNDAIKNATTTFIGLNVLEKRPVRHDTSKHPVNAKERMLSVFQPPHTVTLCLKDAFRSEPVLAEFVAQVAVYRRRGLYRKTTDDVPARAIQLSRL